MITVRLTGERPCPEWAIIELQGEVTVTDLQRESLTFGKLQASALVGSADVNTCKSGHRPALTQDVAEC